MNCFTLKVDNIGLKVCDSGRNYNSRETLVFLHGSPGQISNWKYQVKYFERKYRTIVFDQRGYGESGKPKTVCLEDYINDLDTILEKLNIDLKHVVLIGHSFGGMVAQTYAAKRNILKLVLIGSLVRFKPDIFDKIIWYMPSILWKKILFTKNFLTIRLYRDIYFSKSCPDNIFNEFMADNEKYIESLPAYVYRYLKYFADYDATDFLKRIKVPTLIVVGEEDKVTPPEYSREIAKLIPNSKLVIVKNAGHLILYEKHEELNKIIEEFIRG